MQDWSGLSADAFRDEFDGVPENLTKLQDSYDLCAQALQTYWPKLETAQGDADRALERAIAAQADLTAAQSALGDAQDWVSRAGDEADRLEREGEGAEPPDDAEVRAATRDRQAAQQAQESAQGRVDDAQGRLDAARQLAEQAREMREEAARNAARDIDEASDAGIQNRKWWEDAIHWVTENWDTIVDVCKVVVAVLGIVVMIIGGPLTWVVLAAALVVLADTLIKYGQGRAGLLDVAFAGLDCIPGMKGLTTLGGLARGLKGGLAAARTGMRGLRQGALGLGRRTRGRGIPMNGRTVCGDPVDAATGELLMSAVDLDLPGVLPLVVERHHISGYRYGRSFGTSWASTLDQRLVLDEHGARLFTADGMVLVYPRPTPDGEPVMPVEGPRWGLSWDGGPGSPLTVRCGASGRTLQFAPTPGRPGAELPLTVVTDRNGNHLRFRYDEAGCPSAIEHSGGYRVGVVTTRGSVTALRLLSAPDEPLITAYEFDDAGSLSAVRNSSGLPLRLTYDDRSRLVRWEDRNGYWYAYEYDAEGRCVFNTGTDRVLEYRYAYDTENHRTVVTDSLGHDTVYQFNDSYQLIAETDPLGNTTTREWDRYDRLQTVTDPLGRTTRHAYDERGNVTVLTRPDGAEIRFRHNALDLPTETVEADGTTWSQEYDAAGNRTALVDPAGNRTRFTHHPGGGPASVTDPLGRTLLVTCDAAGLPVAVTDPLGAATRFVRDAFGRVTEHHDPLGGTRILSWTVEGKPLREVDPSGGERRWEWDGEGNCLSHTDAAGGVTRSLYGAFDLPVAHEGPDGARCTVERDTELRITRITDPAGRTWDYRHDAAGRVIAESDFDGRVTRFEHDAAGQVVARTNAAGQTVRYRYDAVGGLTARVLPDGRTTTYARDAAGRTVHAVAPGVDLRRSYDALGRLIGETVNGRTVSVTYDPAGQPVSRTTPRGHTSTWDYDGAGNPVRLSSDGRELTFGRDALGREVTRDVGGFLRGEQEWDAAGRLVGRRLSRAGMPGDAAHHRWAYRADGHPTAVTDPAGTTSFRLDPAGRVLTVAGARGDERYDYDAAGNQTAAHWSAGAAETPATGVREYRGTLLTRAGGVQYTYDAAGRTVMRAVKRLSREPDVWHYTWDEEDRLTGVVTPDGTAWRYLYDPFGRRVAKERLGADGTPVARTDFTWLDAVLVEQTASGGEDDGTTVTWDHDGLHPVAQTERADDGIDRRFYAIVTDLVGMPTELIAEDGSTAWRGGTSLWGAAAAGGGTPLRFPGQYADEETGWYYNHQRHYDPATGRYVTPDPLGLAPQPNPYTYPHNPQVWCDPLGLTPCGNGIISTSQTVEQNLASITARAFGDGFNGLYHPVTRQLEAWLSSEPGALVRRNGGHGQVNARVFEWSVETVAFTAIRAEGGLRVGWHSVSVNWRHFGDPAAPVEHREAIIETLEAITGLPVIRE
nr:DUF6531 domain-containing protein [Streptomyces sp. RFCAC02]